MLVNEASSSVKTASFSIPQGAEIKEIYGSVLLLSDGTLFDYASQVPEDMDTSDGLYALTDEALMKNITATLQNQTIETILQPSPYVTFILTNEGTLYYCYKADVTLLAENVEDLYAAALNTTFTATFALENDWTFDVYATKEGRCIPLMAYYKSTLNGAINQTFDDVRSFYYGGILFRDGTIYGETPTDEEGFLVNADGSLVSIYDLLT